MRGMALVNAATLIAELGDLSRFADPRQLMVYLGLVPRERSSGTSIKRGGPTKGDPPARGLGDLPARCLARRAPWCATFQLCAPRPL
jgi:transposase